MPLKTVNPGPAYTIFLKWTGTILIFLNLISGAFYLLVPALHNFSAEERVFMTTPFSFNLPVLVTLYISFFVYGIIQVLPSRRNHTIYGRLSLPLLFLNLVCLLFLSTYGITGPGIHALLLLLLLLSAAILFRLANKAVVNMNCNLWLQFPFCLGSAWLLTTIPAHAGYFVLNLPFLREAGEGVAGLIFILLMTLTGILVHRRTSSLVFPTVIAWALYTIHNAGGNQSMISDTALAGAILLILIPLMAIVISHARLGRSIYSTN